MMEATYRQFNQKINILFNMMNNRIPNDQQIIKYTAIFKSMCDNTPNQVIELVGPHLWDHRVEISKNNVRYFLDKRYCGSDEELSNLISLIKKLWEESKDNDKNLVSRTITDMLKIYANYLKEM